MFFYITSFRTSSIILSLFATCLLMQLAACGTTANQPATPGSTTSNYQPVTLQNCGHTLTFTKPPERVISTMQNTTDILLSLGLGKRIIGIYFGQSYQSEAGVNDNNNDQYQHLPDLGGDMTGVPSKERVLSTHPDFVFSAYPAGDFLSSYGLVTQDQFKAQGAQIYGMSGECSDDTTQVSATSIYDDILNIGRIFDVQERAQQIVSKMKMRVEAVQQRLAHHPLRPVVAIPIFSSTRTTAPITVVGAGIYTDLLRLAGGSNSFGVQNKTYPSIGPEAFSAQKSEAYIFIRYKAADTAKFASYLFSTYPDIPASRQRRIISIDSFQWNEGIFFPNVVEQLARSFHPEAFA
jgi:iron complex transport system substrate-binding protein